MKPKFAYAWNCINPPRGENLVGYIREHADVVEPEELVDAVGGIKNVVSNLVYGSDSYGEDLDILDDWAVSWYKSRYPDGTPIYFFVHSSVEHVFEPFWYRR